MPKLISPGHGNFETPPLIVEIGATFVELLAVQRHLRADGEERTGVSQPQRSERNNRLRMTGRVSSSGHCDEPLFITTFR
jgi:hypothetical protein